jgi:hypothetical protein
MFPILEEKIKDNAWDWFRGLDSTGDNLITIGQNGLKLWNDENQVIKNIPVFNNFHDNILVSEGESFIFNLDEDKLKFFSVFSNDYYAQADLVINNKHIRNVYNDSLESLVYVVDDEALKVFNLNGDLVGEKANDSNHGYDVVSSRNSDYLYYSTGLEIKKLDKKDLNIIKSVDATILGVPGAWAMGMDLVKNSGGEKLVVFNGSSIVVLDSELEIIDNYEAREEFTGPSESLYLGVNKNPVSIDDYVLLSGGGFGFNEKLDISWLKEKYEVRTDENGRFEKLIKVPAMFPGRTDIKVRGQITDLNYSIGFEVK